MESPWKLNFRVNVVKWTSLWKLKFMRRGVGVAGGGGARDVGGRRDGGWEVGVADRLRARGVGGVVEVGLGGRRGWEWGEGAIQGGGDTSGPLGGTTGARSPLSGA